VPNFTKPARFIGVSLWVNADPGNPGTVSFVRNAVGGLSVSGANSGLFDLGLVLDDLDGTLHLRAQLAVGPAVLTVTDPATFGLGAWHQVGFSADGAQIHLYKDGVEVAARDYTLDLLNTPAVQYLTVGGGVSVDATTGDISIDPSNALIGKIDDLSVWGRPLSLDEVGKIFAAGNQGQPLSSVVLTPPAGGGDVELDVAKSGNNITISWTGSGFRLQSSATPSGGYTDVTGVTGTSYTTTATQTRLFYRLIK
jgi:hypothetical protein